MVFIENLFVVNVFDTSLLLDCLFEIWLCDAFKAFFHNVNIYVAIFLELSLDIEIDEFSLEYNKVS